MPVLLINKNDFREYKQLSKGRDLEVVEQYIQEAQDIDLRELMCDSFYFDLIKNWQEPEYQKLIHGGSYTDADGIQREYKGLKAALVYFSYARYVMRSSSVDTAFGMVQKTDANSQPVPLSEKRDIRDSSIQTANRYWLDVKKYLDEKEDVFTKWKDCCGCSENKNKSKVDII